MKATSSLIILFKNWNIAANKICFVFQVFTGLNLRTIGDPPISRIAKTSSERKE